MLPSHQRKIIEQAKFAYSPLEKRAKEEQRRKQVDATTNRNERLGAFTNKSDCKDDHKDIYKETFDKLVKEKFNEIY